MKSPIELLQVLLDDLGSRCGTSTIHDLKTIMARIEHEGLSFLTITLPSFGADFEKSLDQGYVGHDQFSGFTRSGGLPRFLGGFLDLVFDRRSARLLEQPSVPAIYSVRQLSLMFGKIAIPCSEKRREKAIDGYIKTEQDVRRSDAALSTESIDRYCRIGQLLWAQFFCDVDKDVSRGLVPKHGRGATADHLRGNAKYDQTQWTSRLDEVFPHWEFLYPSESFLYRSDEVTILAPGAETAVKVITVPKTLKTPRIIAEEPTAMQYCQQAVFRSMKKRSRTNDNAWNFVCSDSQEHNRVLAREGSSDGSLATLDLSEASDRVSNQHVLLLLRRHTLTREVVDASRSRKADVLSRGRIVKLRLAKFASMGSALCFPFEAIVFTTVVFCGIEQALARKLTMEDIKSFYGKVRVYGDDIIVPTEYVRPVMRELEAFGFVVNTKKSFWTGKFRESCGADWYAGNDVSIVRMRSMIPTSRQHVPELLSTVSFRNQAYEKGLWRTVDKLDSYIERLIPFPYVEPTSVLLGRLGSDPCQVQRHHDDYHYPIVKGVVAISQLPKSKLGDYGALMKWFLNIGEEPLRGNHLERAGRPVSARIKTRWASPR